MKIIYLSTYRKVSGGSWTPVLESCEIVSPGCLIFLVITTYNTEKEEETKSHFLTKMIILAREESESGKCAIKLMIINEQLYICMWFVMVKQNDEVKVVMIYSPR